MTYDNFDMEEQDKQNIKEDCELRNVQFKDAVASGMA